MNERASVAWPVFMLQTGIILFFPTIPTSRIAYLQTFSDQLTNTYASFFLSSSVMSTEYHRTRSDIETNNIMRLWRTFRSGEQFTDLTVFCGKNRVSHNRGISLHRLVLAGCSRYLAHVLKDNRDESMLFLPDVDESDFVNLVQVLNSLIYISL